MRCSLLRYRIPAVPGPALPLLLTLIFGAAGGRPVSAANITWINPGGGSFTTSSNWSPAVVPGAGDQAIIIASGTYTVTLSTNRTVGSILVGSSSGSGTRRLRVNGVTLTVSGASGVGTTGTLWLDGGSLAGAGTITLNGTLQLNGTCSVSTPLTTAALSTMTVSAPSNVTLPTDFVSNGTLSLSGGAGTTNRLTLAGGTLTNSGTLQTLATGLDSTVIMVPVINNQVVNVGSLLRVRHPAAGLSRQTAAGVWNVNARCELLPSGSGTWGFENAGDFLVAPGQTVVVRNCRDWIIQANSDLSVPLNASWEWHDCGIPANSNNATLVGAGKIHIIDTEAWLPVATNIGLWNIRSQSNVHAPLFRVDSLVDSTVVDSSLIDAGSWIVTAGSRQSLSHSDVVVGTRLDNYGALTTSGTVGLTFSATDSLTSDSLATMTVRPACHLNITGTVPIEVRSAGRLVLHHYGLTGNPATEVSMANASFVNLDGGRVSVPFLGLTAWPVLFHGEFRNLGTVRVESTFFIDTPPGLACHHQNHGSIQVAGLRGNLGVTGNESPRSTFTQVAGELVVPATATTRPVQFVEVDFTVADGNCTGPGNLSFSYGNMTLNNPLTYRFASCSHATVQNYTGQAMATTKTTLWHTSYAGADLVIPPGSTADLTQAIINAPLVNAGATLCKPDPGAPAAQVYLNGRLTNTGTITLADTLTLNAPGAQHLNAGTITVNGGMKMSIVQSESGAQFRNTGSFSGGMQALVVTSGGTFLNDTTGVISGPGTFDMTATTFNNSGTILPGASPGTLTILGDVHLKPTSVLGMEISGTNPGTQYDRLAITGAAELDGTLNVSLTGGFVPATGDVFDLVTCAGSTGAFDSVNLPPAEAFRSLALVPMPGGGTSSPVRLTMVSQQWTAPSTSGGPPSARTGHSVVYAAASNRLIVFGGRDASTAFNDTWILTNANGVGGMPAWSQLATQGVPPAPRWGHASAWDSANNRLIVYGGRANSISGPALSEVWVLENADGTGSPSTWTQLSPGGGSPGPRTGAGVGYNSSTNRLVLFGGVDATAACPLASNDVWVLTHANGLGGSPTWSNVPTSGAQPQPRERGVLAYDSGANRLILHDGDDPCSDFLGEAHVLTHADGTGGAATWTSLALPGLPPRAGHAGIYDAATDRLATIGGLDAPGARRDDILLVTNAAVGGVAGWSQVPPPLQRPSARDGHAVAWDPIYRTIMMFGGEDSTGPRNDLWLLSLVLESGSVSGVPDSIPPPPSPVAPDEVKQFGLRGAPAPNPTSGGVRFEVGMAEAGRTTVDIVDVQGRQVRRLFSGDLTAGHHPMTWDGSLESGPAPSGIYFLRLASGSRVVVRRLTVLK